MNLSLLILSASLSFGANLRSHGALQTNLKDQTFKVSVNEGFHLNEKAPNLLTVDESPFKPDQISAKEAMFSNLPKTWSNARAALYVCDDAITFCETHYLNLKGHGKAVSYKTTKLKVQSRINKHGFIEDDLNKAITLAKKQRKRILIDFSARWCPGCVRFETETFNTKKFKNLTEGYIKVKIDVDRFENSVLSEKYHIKAIPTLLVMNSDQEEISRLIDYQPLPIVESFFTSVKNDPTPLQALKAKSQDALKVGRRLIDAGQYQESLKYLSPLQPPPPELALAKVEAAAASYKTDKNVKTQYMQTLKDAIKAEPSSSRSIIWRTALVGLTDDKTDAKKIMEEGVALADVLLKNPEKLKLAIQTDFVGEYTDYETFLIAINVADLVETADVSEELTQQAWRRAVDVGQTFQIPASRSGPALRYLIILTAAKDYEEADKISAAILKTDPNNGDVQRRRLKVLLAQKKYKEATVLGEKSIKNSYGRNEIWVAESLAKAYMANNQNESALKLLNKYLSKNEIEWSNVQSSRKSMEEMRKTLSK